jgi:hypothetical protein
MPEGERRDMRGARRGSRRNPEAPGGKGYVAGIIEGGRFQSRKEEAVQPYASYAEAEIFPF